MKTTRFRLIEVDIPVTPGQGTEINIPDQDDLRQAVIDGIETYTFSDISTTPTGGAVLTDSQALGIVVTIAQQSNDKVQHVPYNALRVVLNAGEVREFRNLVASWPQCRLRITAPIVVAQPVRALIGVHFHYPGDPS